MSSKDKTKKQNTKKKNPFRFFVFDVLKYTGAIPMWFVMRPKVIYESKAAKKPVKGAAVVIANHFDNLDPITLNFVFWYRRLHVLAKEELFETKFTNWFFNHINCIKVDRGNFNMNSFRRSMDVLESGRPLAIFPEGTRNREDQAKTPIQAFKSGAVMIALRGNVPIVPTYLAKREHWYSRYVAVVGEPIDPQKLCEGTPSLRAMDQISENLREKELKLMEIYQQWKTKKSLK